MSVEPTCAGGGCTTVVRMRATSGRESADPVVVLTSLGGAASWRTLIRGGVTDGDLRGAVRRGQVRTVSRGRYALPQAPGDLVTAGRAGGQLTCVSAALSAGLPVLQPPVVPHVAVPRNRSAPCGDLVAHRSGTSGTGLVVPLAIALVAALRCLSLVNAVVLVDAAVNRRLVSVSALSARLRGPGSVSARIALAAVDGRAESMLETVLRLGLRRAGLPVVSQAWVAGIGRVDFLIGGWLVVEVDGFAFHSSRTDYREDRRRGNALVADGYVLLRFSYEDVMFRLDEVIAQVLATYEAGVRRPGR